MADFGSAESAIPSGGGAATAVEDSPEPERPDSHAAAPIPAGKVPTKLGPHLDLLTRWVEEKPRAMITDFHLLLLERGYSGSYDLVKKKVQALRRGLGRQAGALFASAEAPSAQVEMTRIFLKGQGLIVKAHLFTMTLGHSGRCYAELLPACDLAAFLRCHANAFEALGGVPASVYYDSRQNPMLRRILGNFPFHLPIADCSRHYGYAALATPAFAPWMKGRLKRPGKILQKLFFRLYPYVSLERANAEMREWMAGQASLREGLGASKPERLRPVPGVLFDLNDRRQFLRLRA
jgi:transposase